MTPARAIATGAPRSYAIGSAALLVAVTLGIYWPALGAGFVGDDFMILHRLRPLAGAGDVLRFFRGEFFEYYRPLGFVSQAVDWAIAGQSATQFHLTNLIVHAINVVLVWLIARALSPRPTTALLAALLFALHASNTEAVIWISARFDLLATCFALAAVCWMVRQGAGNGIVPALLFLPALLSKEAAVALPVAAAGWNTFRVRRSTAGTIAAVVPWLVVLVVYSALRHLGGGVSPIGGAARIPKLAAFGVALAVIVALADGRWQRVRAWLEPRRAQCAAAFVALIAIAALLAAFDDGRAGALAREKLSVAGFAGFYLTSPILGPGEAVFGDLTMSAAWFIGVAALLAAGAVIFGLWPARAGLKASAARPTRLGDSRLWFLGTFLVATLLPISALTEGKRYLYLPSAAWALIVALLVDDLQGRWRRTAIVALAVYLATSAVQIAVKIQDWRWAGRMTADGARTVDAALAPACGDGHVVFLTSPVGVRGVYSHFYYETFEVPRGCQPAIFQVVVRVLRFARPFDVHWSGPRQIEISAPSYRNNFRLSRDLREFDIPLGSGERLDLETPLGTLNADTTDGRARLRLNLGPDVSTERVQFYYYTEDRIVPLGTPGSSATGVSR